MAEMWYYTTEGKQQDAVTMKELRRLVGEGVLKPTDMVWKDGMARWIRASSVKELFPDPTAALDHFFTNGKGGGKAEMRTTAAAAPVGATAPPAVEPVLAQAPSAPVDDEPGSPKKHPADDGFDDSDGAARRRPPLKSGGSSTGIIVFLVLGALLLFGALAVGVIILIGMSQDSEGKINPANLVKGEAKYNLDLKPRETDSRKFSFRKGVGYKITVETQPNFNGVDVDITIYDARGQKMDEDILPNPDCEVNWTPTRDGEYRVDVTNVVNPGGAVIDVKSKVTIREANLGQPKEQPKLTPLPPGVLEGKGIRDFTVLPGKEDSSQRFRVKAGHKASFTFFPSAPGPKTNFNLIVVKDNALDQIIAQDIGPDQGAKVSFTLPATEIVVVRVVNAAAKGPGVGAPRGILNYDASP